MKTAATLITVWMHEISYAFAVPDRCLREHSYINCCHVNLLLMVYVLIRKISNNNRCLLREFETCGLHIPCLLPRIRG